ncbi:MAG: roadblock/LC7 domain-containing protein [Wenzhouxiangellaceae bacterium]
MNPSRIHAGPRRELQSILSRLVHSGGTGVNAAALITSDGMALEFTHAADVDVDRFAAMSASLLALAERQIEEAERGHLNQLLIEGTEGAVLLIRAGADYVLTVSTEPGALLGKIFVETRRVATTLRQLMNAEAVPSEHMA